MQNKHMQYSPKASMNFPSQQNGSIAPSNLDPPGYFLKIPGASITQSEDISFEPPGYMFLRVLLPDTVPLGGEAGGCGTHPAHWGTQHSKPLTDGSGHSCTAGQPWPAKAAATSGTHERCPGRKGERS